MNAYENSLQMASNRGGDLPKGQVQGKYRMFYMQDGFRKRVIVITTKDTTRESKIGTTSEIRVQEQTDQQGRNELKGHIVGTANRTNLARTQIQ